MAALVPATERRRAPISHRLGQLGVFVRALAPDPTEWTYDGTCIDHGPRSQARCVCGQRIRYVFVVTRPRDGRSIQIGSVCITTSIPLLLAGGAADLADRLAEGVRRHHATVHERAAASQGALLAPRPRRRRRTAPNAGAAARPQSVPASTQLTMLSPTRRPNRMFQFNGDHDDLSQVAPYIGTFAQTRAEILAATGRSFAYDDEFVDRIPAIANKTSRPPCGTHEQTAIHLLQCLYRAWEMEARLLTLRAEGYEDIEHVDGTTACEHLVLYPRRSMGGPFEEFTSARLVAREPGGSGRPYAVITKGKRTRGPLIDDRGVLARRR